MIVDRVEVGHFSIPTRDIDVAFEAEEQVGVGGVELPCAVFTMAAGNGKPWVYPLARNNSRVTRHVKAGERFGTATTESAATPQCHWTPCYQMSSTAQSTAQTFA
jgi:hypothetical protein